MRIKLRQYLRQFRQLQGDPGYLARGLAVGVFVGIAPLMPFKTVIIVFLTLVFSASTIAGILSCTVICNPITYLPLYYIAWRVGDLLLPGRASWEQIMSWFHALQQVGIREAAVLTAQAGLDICLVMLVGGILLALPFALISYPLASFLFSRMAKKKGS